MRSPYWLNMRVRWMSDRPDGEPVGTVIRVNGPDEVAYLVIRWDDGHPDTTVYEDRLRYLETT